MPTLLELTPTKRLQAALRAAHRSATTEGRQLISWPDLAEAIAARPRPTRGWGRRGPAQLDPDARRRWERAAREAALLGHPYLAPEHLLLVDLPSGRERDLLIEELGQPFGGVRSWRPRGRRSASRARGRALTAQRRRDAEASNGDTSE